MGDGERWACVEAGKVACRLSSASPWALMREMPDSVVDCCLQFQKRAAIDARVARRQQLAYGQAIAHAGVTVCCLPALHDYPDCAFVEDIAVLLENSGVLLRTGRRERRGEIEGVRQFFEAIPYLDRLFRMPQGCRADGGDILRIGKNVYVGLSTRTNWRGFDFIRQIAESKGLQTAPIEVRGALHLKSACTYIGDDTVVAAIELLGIGREKLKKHRIIRCDSDERPAANQVRIGEAVFVPGGFPRMADKLLHRGFSPICIDISEIEKAEAGLSCLAILNNQNGLDPQL